MPVSSSLAELELEERYLTAHFPFFDSVFDPVYKTVGNSWKKASREERKDHFFGQLDFSDGQAVFAKVGLRGVRHDAGPVPQNR
jgi:hypothetical protein